jgi:hypothetical protein
MNLRLPTHRLTRAARLLVLAGVAGVATLALAPAAHADAPPSVKESPQGVRHLDGFWANEYAHAYSCPSTHPWLLNENYAPLGKTLPDGVSINEDWGSWPIDVSISRARTDRDGYLTGTETGFPYSSATNWAGGDHWNQVILHCTKSKSLASKGGDGPQIIPA